MQQWLSSFITNVVTLSNDWKLKKYLDSPAMILQLVVIRTQLKSTNTKSPCPFAPSAIKNHLRFTCNDTYKCWAISPKKIISISKLTFQYSNKKKVLTIENLQFNLYRKKKRKKTDFHIHSPTTHPTKHQISILA